MPCVSDSIGGIFPNTCSKLVCILSLWEATAKADCTPWRTVIIGCILYHWTYHPNRPKSTEGCKPYHHFIYYWTSVGQAANGCSCSVCFLPWSGQSTTIAGCCHHCWSGRVSTSEYDSPAYPNFCSIIKELDSTYYWSNLPKHCTAIKAWESVKRMSRKCKYGLMSGLRGCLACWPHHSDMSSVLAADLVPMTPLCSGIVSAIFEMSYVACRLSLLEKFQTSSTIIATSQELLFWWPGIRKR